MGCTGNETVLSECHHIGIGINNCGHNEDAGVKCLESENPIIIVIYYAVEYGVFIYTL